MKNLKQRAEDVCFGRDDLLDVAEHIANEFGNYLIAEELCGVMAQSAVDFLKNVRTRKVKTCLGEFIIEGNMAYSTEDSEYYYHLPKMNMTNKEIKEFFEELKN